MFASIAALSLPQLAFATDSGCLSANEAVADRAIRLHTELMVVGLSCERLMPEKNLFAGYQTFTQQNRGDLMGWEKTLISFFHALGRGDGRSAFDAYRTRLANESAHRAAQVSTPDFCGSHAPLIARALSFSPKQLRDYVRDDAPETASGLPVCATKVTAEAQTVGTPNKKD